MGLLFRTPPQYGVNQFQMWFNSQGDEDTCQYMARECKSPWLVVTSRLYRKYSCGKKYFPKLKLSVIPKRREGMVEKQKQRDVYCSNKGCDSGISKVGSRSIYSQIRTCINIWWDSYALQMTQLHGMGSYSWNTSEHLMLTLPQCCLFHCWLISK